MGAVVRLQGRDGHRGDALPPSLTDASLGRPAAAPLGRVAEGDREAAWCNRASIARSSVQPKPFVVPAAFGETCDDGGFPAFASRRHMDFHTRKWVKPEDLNPNGSLFGGSLLRWIDEESAIYAILQLDNPRVVTKYMSEINFVSSAGLGDMVELGLSVAAFGRTSLTLRCEVRNLVTRKSILTVERIVYVNLDEHGRPTPHGKQGRAGEGEGDDA